MGLNIPESLYTPTVFSPFIQPITKHVRLKEDLSPISRPCVQSEATWPSPTSGEIGRPKSPVPCPAILAGRPAEIDDSDARENIQERRDR